MLVDPTLEQRFLKSDKPHVVMVTNHGMHAWEIDAGLPDTGGQNAYVNQLSHTLARLGFRVTIFNRGGYTHPHSGAFRRGSSYGSANERLVYLEDSRDEFIRKEDMAPQVEELAVDLVARLQGAPEPVAFVSHYWDGAAVVEEARSRLGLGAPHIWIPHSLGALKKQGTPQQQWDELRIGERIEREEELLGLVDLVGATSEAMKRTLSEDYGISRALFLPPCVDERRFNVTNPKDDLSARRLLAEILGRREEDIARSRIITEVSRTDRTKRKDVLIEAFARIRRHYPDTVLAITIDRNAGELYRELSALITERGVSGNVAVLGSIGTYLPSLYGMTDVYCTPSIMEGFGMSIQEAAACGVPAVASRRVPFAVEYLLGTSVRERGQLQVGEGAVVVPPDSVGATAEGLEFFLQDERRRRAMGAAAHKITIPRFTWGAVTRAFLEEAGIEIPGEGATDIEQ